MRVARPANRRGPAGTSRGDAVAGNVLRSIAAGVVAQGDVAWMTSGPQLWRIDPATGAALGSALAAGAGPVALGPDALWTTRVPACGPDRDDPSREAERRDRLTGEVVETGRDLGALLGSHGAPDGKLAATPGALRALGTPATIIRRGVDGSLRGVPGRGYIDLASDGSRLLTLRGDGVMVTLDGATGRIERRRSVGVNHRSESPVAPARCPGDLSGRRALIHVGR